MAQILSPIDATDAEIERLVDAIDEQAQHAGLSAEPVKQLRNILKRRQEAEALLRQQRQEGRLLLALEAMSDGFAVLDSHWRYIYVNVAATKLLGKVREELLGRTPWEACPEADAALLLSNFERSIEEKRPVEFEVFCHTFGATLECRCHPSPEGVSLFFGDITERKRTERELRESRDRLALALEVVQAGMVQWDLRNNKAWWNARSFEMYGYPPDSFEPTYQFWCSRLHPEDSERVPAEFQRCLREHISDIAPEYRIVRPTGEVRWIKGIGRIAFDADGQPESFTGIALDITEAKLAERRLRESEERFRLLVEGVQEYALFLLDPSGHIISWNSGAERIKGYRGNEILGRHISICYTPEDVENGMPQHDIEVAAQQGRCEWKGWVVRKDGSQFWAEVLLTALKNADGTLRGFAELARDITQRTQAEEALRQSEQFKQAVLDSLPAHIAVLDGQGLILAVNNSWLRFARENGEANEQRIGAGADYLQVCRNATNADSPLALEALEGIEAVLSGRREEFVLEYPCHSPTQQRWYLMHVMPVRSGPGGTPEQTSGAVVTHLDITARRLAEEAVRQSADWLRLAMDAADLGTWDYYPPTGRLLWSDRCKAMFGLPPDVTMSYDQFLQHVHPDDRDYANRGIEESCEAAGPGTQDLEYRALRPDGTIRWIKVMGKTFFAGSGLDRHAIRIVGTAQDITQRRAIEGELHAARDAAEAANRSKDQFIAVLSHELRTPLTPVLTELQVMERDQKVSAQQRESAQMMHRNLAMETRLIDDLLDVTRLTRGKLELHIAPVDLHSLLQHALGLCDSDLRSKRLQCHMQLDAPAHYVQGDASRLEQVFWNLLKNAIKFTPSGGRIIVHSQQVESDDIEVSIQDSGVGIEPELLPYIFNAFEQGGKEKTRQFGGLGLGLAISKGVVDLHSGTLSVASAGKGQGATFIVHLHTLAQAPSARAEVQRSPATGRAGEAGTEGAGGKRLLLVEDHPDTGKVMARVLRSFGYNVRRADSVATALRVADTEPFDLLICDIGLPDGSGLDLMRQLSLRRPVKGIALSGYGMEEDVRKSKQAGFVEHLTKPVDLQQLQEVLDRVLA